jgi:hypothetical protein
MFLLFREANTVGVGVVGGGSITCLTWSNDSTTILAATEYGVVIGWSINMEN